MFVRTIICMYTINLILWNKIQPEFRFLFRNKSFDSFNEPLLAKIGLKPYGNQGYQIDYF